jgi:hypothetical protein
MRRIEQIDGDVRLLDEVRTTLDEFGGTPEAVEAVAGKVGELLEERADLLSS